MRSYAVLAALAVSAAAATPALAQTAPKVQAGVLECTASPSTSFILGSKRDLACDFKTGVVGSQTTVASFTGKVERFGLDLGAVGASKVAWVVFAPTASAAASELAGRYVGVSADAVVGIGGGANVLLGGSQKTIALQPVSFQGSTGFQIAAGVADLTLEPVVPPVSKKKKITK